MFIRATKVKFLDGVKAEFTYIDGSVVEYDFSVMYKKYPQLKALENRKLFESGKLDQLGHGIIWNDELDFDTTGIYYCGKKVRIVDVPIKEKLGFEIMLARENAGLTQAQLSKLCGVNQADISRLESGFGNPSLDKIEKIAKALKKKIDIKIS